MKILWCQDYNIFAFPGGAERNDVRIVHEGIRRGHDITMDFEAQWDYAILSNCATIDPKIIDEICSFHKHIFFFHDFVFCRYRLFFSALEKCKRCKFAQAWKKRFLDSKLLIYLSPLHKEFHERFIPELKDLPNICVPSSVNPNLFTQSPPVQGTALSINSLLPFKGAQRTLEFISQHQELSVNIISPNPLNLPLPPNVLNITDHVPYSHIIQYLQESEFYIELPQTPQPFNRTFVEAKLAGCKVITNPLAGAVSYPWFSNLVEMRYQLLNAPKNFWKEVEKYAG